MHFYYLFISSHSGCSFRWFGCFDCWTFRWWQHFSLQNSRTLLHYAFSLALESFKHARPLALSPCALLSIRSFSGCCRRQCERKRQTHTHTPREKKKLTMQFNVSFALVPETFLLLFRLWACDCQCGMNEIRHGHIVHPFEMKRKRWSEAFSFFCASWLLTYSMHSLSVRSLARSFTRPMLPIWVCFSVLLLSMCVALVLLCKTTHFKCRLCAINTKGTIHS